MQLGGGHVHDLTGGGGLGARQDFKSFLVGPSPATEGFYHHRNEVDTLRIASGRGLTIHALALLVGSCCSQLCVAMAAAVTTDAWRGEVIAKSMATFLPRAHVGK